MEFPAMLYKRGSSLEWDGEWFDSVVVNDQDELDIALADGWSIGKPEAKPFAPEEPEAPAEPSKRKPGRPARAG